jgi:hypothetical protein
VHSRMMWDEGRAECLSYAPHVVVVVASVREWDVGGGATCRVRQTIVRDVLCALCVLKFNGESLGEDS